MLGKAARGKRFGLVACMVAVACTTGVVQPALSHDPTAEPQGNWTQVFKTVAAGTPTNRPGRGLQYLCIDELTQFNGGKPPVFSETDSPWVHGLNVVISEIPYVEGRVRWENHRFKQVLKGNTRRFIGNGLPNHVTGEFPVRKGTAAYPYYESAIADSPYFTADRIPIAAYDLDITIPRNPKYHDKPTCINQLVSGVATQTGVVWHANIALGEGWVDPIAALPTDICFGHPYDKEYHYHGWSWKCFPDQGKPWRHSPLFGYALDGFGIYGPLSAGGKVVTNADLDECHGHFGVVDWDGKKRFMYHYHLNYEFPYGPGCLRGRPLEKVNDAMLKEISVRRRAATAQHAEPQTP